MNRVQLTGYLGRDPEVRQTKGGTSVCELSVATTERRKDGDEWVNHTEWHRVVVWGKKAEFCGQDLRKGSFVSVSGSLFTEKWQDKDGNDRYTTKIKADMDAGVEYPKSGRQDDDGGGRGRDDRRDDRRQDDRRGDDRGRSDERPKRQDDRSNGRDDRGRSDDRGQTGGRNPHADEDEVPF